MSWLFEPFPTPGLPVVGEHALYPVRRIFCVGRNYAEHAAEMGNEVDREAPFYFTKSPYSLVRSGATLPYPPGTENYHHEMEFVLALGADVFRADAAAAEAAIWGMGCGLDMTRRDLQNVAKEKRRPWDIGKDVEGSAVLGDLTRVEAFGAIAGQRIALTVNGETRQNAVLSDMVWSSVEIVSHLSRYYHLGPGDLIMTGTPAGVGPVRPGDALVGEIDGLAPVRLTITEPE